MSPSKRPPQPDGEPPGRRGRKLGPIADRVGAAHRAWLEPLRARFFDSGLTIGELSNQTRYSKSKISELLRGAGLYPRWEITSSVLQALNVPTWPMLRLWMAAAAEAHKKPNWINGCIETETVVLSTGPAKPPVDTGPAKPPVDHQGFVQLNRVRYTRYAQTFLSDSKQASAVVSETFDILWLRWDETLRSANVQKFAWSVLRSGVMARTPHIDGCPDLAPAAFNTVVLGRTEAPALFDQIEESLSLFKAMSRLPDHQLDVMVLKYLRRMDDTVVADVLGVPLVSVQTADRYAKKTLRGIFDSNDPPEGTPQ
ncbi:MULTISPECIES: sigma-70 family RNA polymerase sigma factor [Streptomyces violaceusniger group]|uniref:Sigma-70 family RNA polymerase sigma factor n=2 Tax=Streptomyces rhizosphaericus TaxID=114699 RepID=A0ABN1S651_9ACTN|nr:MULTISPECIES: sigma-70 family RNA polymerase sigma factor [Streptomyces violaceusniger group]